MLQKTTIFIIKKVGGIVKLYFFKNMIVKKCAQKNNTQQIENGKIYHDNSFLTLCKGMVRLWITSFTRPESTDMHGLKRRARPGLRAYALMGI